MYVVLQNFDDLYHFCFTYRLRALAVLRSTSNHGDGLDLLRFVELPIFIDLPNILVEFSKRKQLKISTFSFIVQFALLGFKFVTDYVMCCRKSDSLSLFQNILFCDALVLSEETE